MLKPQESSGQGLQGWGGRAGGLLIHKSPMLEISPASVPGSHAFTTIYKPSHRNTTYHYGLCTKQWGHSREQGTSLIVGSSSTSKFPEVLLSPGFKKLAVLTPPSPQLSNCLLSSTVFFYISLALSLSLSILTETIPHNHNSPTHNLPLTPPVLVQALNNLHPKY